MQLGTRWAAGTTPPPSVPGNLREAIAQADADAPEGSHWTLTWLEGRALAELDSGVEVVELADGSVVARPWQD